MGNTLYLLMYNNWQFCFRSSMLVLAKLLNHFSEAKKTLILFQSKNLQKKTCHESPVKSLISLKDFWAVPVSSNGWFNVFSFPMGYFAIIAFWWLLENQRKNFLIRMFFFSLYFWIWYKHISFEYFRPHRALFKNSRKNKLVKRVLRKGNFRQTKKSSSFDDW